MTIFVLNACYNSVYHHIKIIIMALTVFLAFCCGSAVSGKIVLLYFQPCISLAEPQIVRRRLSSSLSVVCHRRYALGCLAGFEFGFARRTFLNCRRYIKKRHSAATGLPFFVFCRNYSLFSQSVILLSTASSYFFDRLLNDAPGKIFAFLALAAKSSK